MIQRTWYQKWISQFRLLMWKNWRLTKRNRRGTFVQLIAPGIFILILFVLQQALISSTQRKEYQDTAHPIEADIGNIPLCNVGPHTSQCWTFLYSPQNSSDVQDIVRLIRTNNNPVIPEESVMGFDSPKDIDDFIFSHFNQTQGAFLFDIGPPPANSTVTKSIYYTLQVNQTDQYSHGIAILHQMSITVPMQYAVERAILLHLTNGAATLEVQTVSFAHPQEVAVNVIGSSGPIWFFAALMFNFVVGLGQIVTEKELKLREIMKVMGLYDSVYWCSWFVTMFLFSTWTVFALITFGCIFQFDFFLRNAFGLYFFLLQLFAMSLIALTFLISTLVKKSSAATSIGFLVFILGFFIQLGAAFVFGASSYDWLRVILSLLSPAMLQLGLSVLGTATQTDAFTGMRWSSVNSAADTGTPYAFTKMYGYLILDFFIYMILAIYFDNVLPTAYGTRRPYYYFLQPSYWTGKSRPITKDMKGAHGLTMVESEEVDEDVRAEAEAVRNETYPKTAAVILDGLRKVYAGDGCCGGEGFVAVKGISMYMETESVFCLLGHNGAGKTTAIHMLAGFHQATAGDAQIFGNSIRTNMSQVQQDMGICCQFDVLWNELTGEEHLYLFAGLRNIAPVDIPGEVDRLLADVELTDARKMTSASYSGGMKRRLSVAISLIGDPKIVFLDEPTTGMDPVTRRKVWDTIERVKKDKVIVLTTHSMEEADILGDKIAIMARGRIECIGTSLRLKQRFGAGYIMSVGTKLDKVEAVQEFFQSNIEGVKISGVAVGGYMNFTIPRDSTKDLVPFFRKIEQNKEDLGIIDLQLSLTTLEEVFLTISEKAELKNIARKVSENHGKKEKKSKKRDDPDVEAQDRKARKRVSKWDQFKALFIKSAIVQKRDKKTACCQCLTPFVLVLILFLFNILINNIINASPTSVVQYPQTTPPFHLLTRTSDIGVWLQPSNTALIDLQLNGSKLLYTQDAGVDVGNYDDGTGLLGHVSPSFGKRFNHKFLAFSTFGTGSNATSETPNVNFTTNYFELPSKDDVDNELYNMHNNGLPSIVGGYHFQEIDFKTNTFRWSIFYNYSLTVGEDVPFLFNRISNSIAQNLLNNSAIVFLTGVKEMPTLMSKLDVDIASLAGSFFYILILLQLLPVFLANIATEKESKVKEIMGMMGLEQSIYWIVTYLFDWILYFGVMMFLIIAGLIFRFRVFVINTFWSYFILFFLWGHVLIALSFFLSVFFSRKRTALVTGYFLILGIALVCSLLVENIIGEIDTVSASTRSAISIVPPFALYRGLAYLAAEVSQQGPGYSNKTLTDPSVNLGEVYGWLIFHWVVLMALWLYCEMVIPSGWGVKRHPLFFLGFGKHNAEFDHLEEENPLEAEDVKAERKRVFAGEQDLAIQVKNLRKVYPAADGNPPKVAVKGVSFGVENNSCLGILGHNGAGKTTLIHMLIGLFNSSSGTAYIHGYNLEDELDAIRTIMGICPQHDVLWDTLTAKEHLMFYGRIKNLKGSELDRQVSSILKKVNLYDVRNKQSHQFSGGMKRRLSVAISVLGNPKVIYLDEPSTGLDPRSRQELWEVINEAKKTAAVILTTHSMEEADALCDRITIMAEGEIKCIGVAADLKGRFGEGFKLSLQVAKGEDDSRADEFVRKTVPSAVLINELAGTRNYQVKKEDVTLESIFDAFESHKEELNITDWAITNTTLEEVFLRISMPPEENPRIKAESN